MVDTLRRTRCLLCKMVWTLQDSNLIQNPRENEEICDLVFYVYGFIYFSLNLCLSFGFSRLLSIIIQDSLGHGLVGFDPFYFSSF